MRIGIGIGPVLGNPGSLDEAVAEYVQAEEDGFPAAWTANLTSGFDALTVLALAGRATKRIELGTFVVPTYPRHPMVMAQTALTTAAAAPGRFVLGIGLSHRVVIEQSMGLDYSKPLRHMREYLAVLLPLLAGDPVRFRGEEFRVTAQVQVEGATRPPVLVAALGPQMLRLAGRVADGTATWMGGPDYLRNTAIPEITAAAREAGRPAPRILAGFPIAVTTKTAEAREAAARIFAVYGQLPSYRAALDRGGYGGPGDVAIVGDEASVRRQVADLAEMGVTDLNSGIYAVDGDPGVQARTRELLAGLARG